VSELYDLSLRSLFEKFEEKISKLYPLFIEHTPIGYPRTLGVDTYQIKVGVVLRGYRGQAPAPFDLQADLALNFRDFDYQVVALGREVAKKLYSEPILSDESEQIATDILKQLFEQIKQQGQRGR
jgi:hypothetical protein